MSWRIRSKGSSDVVKRGSAFGQRSTAADNAFDPFNETNFPITPSTREISKEEEALINSQRLVVNYLLYPEEDEETSSRAAKNSLPPLRVHISLKRDSEGGIADKPCESTAAHPTLWKRMVAEIGASYYPSELLTDSRTALLKGAGFKRQKKHASPKKSLLQQLESNETNGDQSPKSQADKGSDAAEQSSISSDDSLGGDDYNIRFDFEDEGARDDYDDDTGGGGNGGGDFDDSYN